MSTFEIKSLFEGPKDEKSDFFGASGCFLSDFQSVGDGPLETLATGFGVYISRFGGISRLQLDMPKKVVQKWVKIVIPLLV